MASFFFVQLRRTKEYGDRREINRHKYKKLIRFEEKNVEWIAEHFLGNNYESRGGALSNKKKTEIFLRYLADPGFQVGVAHDLGVDQSTVSKTLSWVKK